MILQKLFYSKILSRKYLERVVESNKIVAILSLDKIDYNLLYNNKQSKYLYYIKKRIQK